MMMNTEVLNAAVSFLRSLGINVGAIVGAGSFDTLASDVHKGLAG